MLIALRTVPGVSSRHGLFQGLPPIADRQSRMKQGDLVLRPGDDRPWRITDLRGDGRARIEVVGEAWSRVRILPIVDLRRYPGRDPGPEPAIRTPAEDGQVPPHIVCGPALG